MDYHSIFLFQGLTEADIAQMEHDRCLRRKAFARRQTIFHTGDTVHEIGIVLRGAVHIESIDLWGSKSILSEVGEGQAFAETYAFCGEPLMVDVLAAADCEVLFLDTAALSRPHAEHSWQDRLLRNLLLVSMKKNLALSRRILCTAPKTVRGRLLTYLSGQAVQAGGMEFDLPFNRQQLADYLNLDRSALSKELCRMRDEGLLTFRSICNALVVTIFPQVVAQLRDDLLELLVAFALQFGQFHRLPKHDGDLQRQIPFFHGVLHIFTVRTACGLIQFFAAAFLQVPEPPHIRIDLCVRSLRCM